MSNKINWEQLNYDFFIATKDFETLKEVNDLSTMAVNGTEFQSLRETLLNERDAIYDEFNLDSVDKLGYEFDLLFGLKLYKVLNSEYRITNRIASNDDLWRFLSVKVIPDIVHSRWGFNEDRYYKLPRRIWLKNIYWYIHLSWRIDEETTYQLLKDNTTDTIMNLVERPGVGYYINLYREIMYQYSTLEDSSRQLFRKALKLNTALLPVTYPELIDGGISEYVRYIFDKVQVDDFDN